MVSEKRTGNFAQRIAMNATLAVIVMLGLLVPAFSQQETDPTWYDPAAGRSRLRFNTRSRDRLMAKPGENSDQLRPDAKATEQRVSKRSRSRAHPGDCPK
jgi:hypothetical protein